MKHVTVPRPYSLIVAVICFFILATFSPAAGTQAPVSQFLKAHSHFLEGGSLYADGNYEKSITVLRKCLKIFPLHDGAHFLLAEICLKQRKLADADTYIRAAKQNFLELKGWYQGPFREYLEKLRKKQVKNREDIPLLEENKPYGNCRHRQKLTHAIQQIHSENAKIDSLLAAFSSRGDQIPAAYHYLHGNVYFLSRRYPEAVREYNETLKKDPSHGYACNNLANLYFQLKRYEKAREYLDRAVSCGARINPRFREALDKMIGKNSTG